MLRLQTNRAAELVELLAPGRPGAASASTPPRASRVRCRPVGAHMQVERD